METRYESNNPIAAMVRSRREEIEKYRWIESERVGHDIGWQRAVREWCRQHYEAWQFHILEEPSRVPDVVAPRGRRRSMEPGHRAKLSASMKAWWEARKTAER